MEQNQEPQTPPTGTEPTAQSKTAEKLLAEKEAELAALQQTNTELQAQKEHWRGKYERDITSIIPPTPAPSEELDEVFSDEGKLLGKKISDLEGEVSSLKRDLTLERLQAKYPILKDKAGEFEEFRSDSENKGMNLATAAKAFLVEKGLLESEPLRKGLEKPTGGGQTIPEPTYSVEEVRDMMENDYPRYEKLVKDGKIT